MSKRRREKNYWAKLNERYPTGKAARERAKALRLYEHTSHVTVDRVGDEFVVQFSAARWWLDELKKARIKL